MHRQPTPPAAYIIRRVAGTVGVLRVDHDRSKRPVRHVVHNSPTGLEYGYLGSGPADLAHSLLCDFLEVDAVHPAIYQAFKHDVIAPLDHEAAHHRIDAVTIALWLAHNQTREAE